MSETGTIDQLEPVQRDVLRALGRGAGLDDVAGRVQRSPDEVRELADAAMQTLAGAEDGLGDDDRRLLGDYVLGRSSPGRAAGAWKLMAGSGPALAWAARLREATDDLLEEARPLPSDEDAISPTEASRARTGERGTPTLAQRRARRNRRRSALAAQQAQAELQSPFRSEAVEAQQEAEDRVELPEFAPRPAQLATYALLVVLCVGLAFAIITRIPVNTSAIALIARLPADAPGAAPDVQTLAIFPQTSAPSDDAGSGADVRPGDELRVALPGRRERTPIRLRYVSDGIVSARDIIDRYRLPLGQANRVTGPAYVAIGTLRPPAGTSPRSFEGTTSNQASVQTGSRRIISLLF